MKTDLLVKIGLGVLMAGGIGWKVYDYNQEQKSVTPQTEQTESKGNEGDSNIATAELKPTQSPTSLNIERVKPVDGQLYGIVEVGAKGFNAFVIKADKQDNWEIVMKDFDESLAIDGFATTADVTKQLRVYLSKISDKGVPGKNTHFVISSGALKHPNTHLIAKAIKEMGYVVNEATADAEGKYALKATIPSNELSTSTSIDIGSGNTKITWTSNGKTTSIETHGSKAINLGISREQVLKDVTEAMAKVPSENLKNIYFIGGTPFKMAKQSKKGDERFTCLVEAEKYDNKDDESFKTGLVIYDGIRKSLGDKPNYIFDWDANFSIGLLLNLN